MALELGNSSLFFATIHHVFLKKKKSSRHHPLRFHVLFCSAIMVLFIFIPSSLFVICLFRHHPLRFHVFFFPAIMWFFRCILPSFSAIMWFFLCIRPSFSPQPSTEVLHQRGQQRLLGLVRPRRLQAPGLRKDHQRHGDSARSHVSGQQYCGWTKSCTNLKPWNDDSPVNANTRSGFNLGFKVVRNGKSTSHREMKPWWKP